MITIDITQDNNYLYVTNLDERSGAILESVFQREKPQAFFIRKKYGYANTLMSFAMKKLDDRGDIYLYMPVGLYLYLLKAIKEHNIPCDFSDNFKNYLNDIQNNLTYDDFRSWIDDVFENAKMKDKETGGYIDFFPYDYQIQGAYRALKSKRACLDMATSSGKTLVSYIAWRYTFQNKGMKRCMVIEPRKELCNQTLERFKEYESYLAPEKRIEWTGVALHSDMKKFEKDLEPKANVVIGTMSSLSRKDSFWCKDINTIIIDECHHAATDSVAGILTRCYKAVYRIAVSGTFPQDKTFNALFIQSKVGPKVYTYTTDELINVDKQATPLYISFRVLDYAPDEHKRGLYFQRLTEKMVDEFGFGSKAMKREEEYIFANEKRLNYIADIALRLNTNTLILYSDVQGMYGEKIKDAINKIDTTNRKNIYIIKGEVSMTNREWIKSQMLSDLSGNTIIIGSIGTMGEGIDINSIGAIILTANTQSENQVRQFIGRVIRKYKRKKHALMIDICDNFNVKEGDDKYTSYSMKHGRERLKIYKQYKFQVKKENVKL